MNINWLKQVGLLCVVFSLLFSPFQVTPAHAIDAPTLLAPANGLTTTVTDTPPLGIPEFKWAPVVGATSYRLQVSADIGFTTQVVNITTPNTSYTPTGANVFPDGTWYWRVRVETPAPVSDYSTIWSFTKQWASFDNKPVLISPDAYSTIDFYDPPFFSWGVVTGAAKYKLQIYTSPGGWASPLYTATTLTTSHQPNNKLSNGTYYWRVVPVDIGNRDGTPSEERSFNAGYSLIPTLLEPVNNATPTFTPTFRWTAVRGAQYYRLQYTTDSTFGSNITQIDTRNTAYTPINTLPNDVNYYWRVRVYSGNSITDWSPVYSFIKRWYIKPVLLTPTNNYQHTRFPIYSWSPVPGAARYFVEISKLANFSPIYDSGYTANTFYSPSKYDGENVTYYWRVTPYDGNNNKGKESDTASYRSYYNSLAPHQVYPLYYYPPNEFAGYPGVATTPYEDRTVALPIFIWHRVYQPFSEPNRGEIYADSYRVQVSTDPTFSSLSWSVDTENQYAAPTSSNPFTPVANTDYYWRVRTLIGGSDAGPWSQVWKTRFDPSRGLTPTGGPAPSLIRPTTGFEFAEMTPLLEWFPLNNASSYDVQISQDESFNTVVDSATVPYPVYAPTQILAQRSLGDVNFGVYYWRVRQSPSGAWSEVRRFQVAAQSQWQFTRTLGASENRLQIGSDPAGDAADSDYDLTTLQAAQANNYWHFGFHVPTSPTKNVTYALYLDTDHQEGSGATSDARSYSVTTIPTYRPEYAIYILQESGSYSASKVFLYRWTGSNWQVQVLDDIGGNISYSSGYVEVQLPNTAIGYQDTGGSYAVSVFSLPASSGQPQDSVPSDPAIPGSGPISRFSNVTERLNLLAPPNDAGIDPYTTPSVLPFFWDWPILAPWSGAYMKAYLDPQFTSEAGTYTLSSDTAYYGQISHAWEKDFLGDNTYYWRVQPRYRVGSNLYNGAWSQGWRFERLGLTPQNLKTSVTFATPTFSWDMVEGAEYYDLQVSTDPSFGSTVINISTRQNSYTYENTMPNGSYYWRVRVRRNGSVVNNWTTAQSFTLSLPTPTGLAHTPSGVVGRAPTLCWTPVIVNSLSGDPVFAAWKYRVDISKEPTFSSVFDTIDTEQRCWTPIKGYDDGQYYWRVAVIDGQSRLGNYSAAATFTKQYPITTLVSPTSGANLDTTPTFIWTPVNGAARYKFEASENPTFTPLYDSTTTDNTRWTPTKVYAGGKTYYWRVAIVDNDGKVGPFVDATIILESATPTVTSISRVNVNPNGLASVQFQVIFSKSVTDVDSSDFSFTKTGAISGNTITNVSGSGTTYTVTVNTGTGNGTLRLDVPTSAVIKDLDGNRLSGLPYTGGEVYTIAKGPIPSTWVGGISIRSNQNVVAVARPHIDTQITSYIGANAGSTLQFAPMLFKGAFGGSYNSALYVQNVSTASASITIQFINSDGAVVYSKNDTLAASASKGYWLPSEAGIPSGFAGSAKITSTQNILAVGRPHIGSEVMTYNGFSDGAATAWLPMFFKNGFGTYNTAVYIQNVTGNSANLTIQYINVNGTVACTKSDTLAGNAVKGYWSLSASCDSGTLPNGFVGGVKVTSTQNIVTVGRVHLGTQITTYNGFSSGATTTYAPMLFRKAFGGTYNSALYLQNISGTSATVTVQYLTSAGTVAATQNLTLDAGAISSIWLPTVSGLADDFAGGAKVTSTQNIVAVGRPHLGNEITAYNGTLSGSLNAYLPMLFKNAYTPTYQSAFYIQNTTGSSANVDISFYDSAGSLSCVKHITLAGNATQGFWMPSVTCAP